LMCVVLSLPLPAAAAPQAQPRSNIRFADMDRNGDGVITRAEWRGSARSFQVHDWNNDGVLSGDELRPGARRPAQATSRQDMGSAYSDYEFDDWTEEGFAGLDHNRDNRITRDEWHFDQETFRRADHDRNGSISRAEFLGTDIPGDDDRNDRLRDVDVNNDGRVTRSEWHGDTREFDRLDENRDGVLSGTELNTEPPPDLFTSVDVNRDGIVERDEWHWSRSSFDARDGNRDGRLSRAEFEGGSTSTRSTAYRAGYDRGLAEGRAAGREDRERNQGWDLEGQRELETADSGYEPRVGSRADYQGGYREGFRRGYREGFGR
jgi:Ca2+-binding EF-hand superfamily protein